MKFVRTGSSGSGRGILPVWIFFSSHAMLSPSVRMVCIPSASCGFAGQPAVYAVPVLRRHDRHVVDREILVQPVERRARTAAPADGYGCCRLEAEQLPCRVEEPVQNRAQGTVRAGVVGWRTDDETVRSGQFSVQRIVQFVPKDAAAELAAFVAGDAALHGFRADRGNPGTNSQNTC